MSKVRISLNILLFPILICVLSPDFLHATDIKHGGMIKLSVHAPIGYGKLFTVGFSNDAWLDAPVRSTITVRDGGGQTVFEETLQTDGDVPAYTEGTLTTQIPFFPEIIGLYTITSHVEPVGMGDIDESNNDWEGTVEAFEAPGLVLFPGQGLDLFQLDFTFPTYMQENSSYGLVALDWDEAFELAGFASGFLNIATGTDWIVQNFIYDISTGYQGMSTMFNLGVDEGVDVTELDILAILSEEPLLDIGLQPASFYDVGERPYNAAGIGMPKGNIMTPIPFERIPFEEGGRSHVVWQHGHVTVEQDKNQCAPASVANSFQWLENTQSLTVPDEHKPGIRDNTLIGKIDTSMGRATHDGVSYDGLLRGIVKYVNAAGLGDSLDIKHKNRKGTTFFTDDSVKIANAMSVPNTDTSVSLIDWILAEMDSSENVELIIKWDECGAHAIDLIGGGYVEGIPWIAWVHDANQGFNDNGTPGDTSDDKPAMNGGLTADSGGVGHSYVVNDSLRAFIGGQTKRATISCAVSESKRKIVTGVNEDEGTIPNEFYLGQNYPNPFNPSTTIFYSIPQRAHVSLTVYDILGRQIAVLLNQEKSAGNYEVEFNAQSLASGIYVYELKAGKFTTSKKMILLR